MVPSTILLIDLSSKFNGWEFELQVLIFKHESLYLSNAHQLC